MRYAWRTQNDHPSTDKAYGDAAATVNDQPSLTQQQFTAETDLNVIMERYGVTNRAIPAGAWPKGMPTIDLTEFSGMELRDAMDRIEEAKQAFGNLPATIRSRFNNNPAEMWEFLNNPLNGEEAVTLGLLQKREPVAPVSTAAPAAPTSAPTSTAPST